MKEEFRFMRSIGDMQRMFSVSARTLRYYEEIGLIEAARHNGRRYYSKECERRLELILLGKEFGLSLDEISIFLEIQDSSTDVSNRQQRLRALLNKHIRRLEEQKNTIDLQVASAREYAESLSLHAVSQSQQPLERVLLD